LRLSLGGIAALRDGGRGKPEAFRTESGKAARQSSVLAKQSSDLVHQLQ